MEAGCSYRGRQFVVKEKHAAVIEMVENANGLGTVTTNPLNAKLNPICHLLAFFVAHRILHVSRIRINDPSSAGRFGAPTQ